MSALLDAVKWNADGLVAAVVQDRLSGRVLMQAWMNRDALQRTLDTREATFWSRSRQEQWIKGASSGNTQQVQEVRLDCDADCVLLSVDPAGPACHTGATSCFYTLLAGDALQPGGVPAGNFLDKLSAVLEARKQEPDENSYAASLYAAGREKILRKLGEEAIETVLAGQSGNSADLVHELADLWFHSLVLLADAGLSAQDVINELAAREGVSGLDEKASRSARGPGES